MRTTALLLAAALLTACGSDGQAGHSHAAAAEHQDSKQHEQADRLQLHAGEKWAVNEEMKPHIEEARLALEDYIRDHDTDYKGLGQNLEQQNQALIQSCTMTGKSHEELHKWLHPHMGLVDALSKAQNEQEAKSIIDDLEHSFQIYEDHFQ